ncbi:MAG: hypothetical protein JXJ04_14495 [Spirochaetales bacterium]|nr:hypothetical protein [Spirochaetales bacterium]
MELLEIIRKAQTGPDQKRTEYCKKLFDMYKEFIIKQFLIYSPYTEKEKTIEFITTLALEFYSVIKNKFRNFKVKKQYTREKPEEHLWKYFQTVTDSTIDRALIHLSHNEENQAIRNKAGEMIKKKYRDQIEALISGRVRNSATPGAEQLKGFELEEFWENETKRLVDRFYNDKFAKITIHFEKDNSNSIFRNYVEKAVKNFLTDYYRGKSVKKMRRLLLYRDDLPETLFTTLRDLKGHGNLFYYKKKQDSLSIRDIHKALMVIKSLNLPGKQVREVDHIFKKSRKRAEYQRIIDNIGAYISEKCRDEMCENRLTPRIIKILLYSGDSVMKNKLSFSEKEITLAGKRLEKCVICLDIDGREVFYRN